ncbi:serine/threonine protein kinase [Staphylotrichum tortipilum]|uniref:Serine/threonine protein kinase n=1 Tax=Staphylotrichum tortipilum TaxID=2831512 RepID=A0AAN6RVI5_9PEZI|nr:serine/threonine protein kinase [Staphylotrichum longicolle]
MARPANPAALFHLHPDNRHFVSDVTEEGELGLEVGFHVASVPSRPNVSGVHVSLEIHPDTLVVLLSTRSKRASSVAVRVEAKTADKPGEAPPPAPGLALRPGETVEGDCVLSYGVIYTVTIAGHHFRLVWRDEDPLSFRKQAIEHYTAAMERQVQGNVRSRFLPTEPDSEAHTWHNTRIHTAKPPPVKETEAAPRVRIGGGQFGSIYRVAEDINGHAFAVKVIHLHKYPDPEQARALAHREINALKRLKHKNIIKCLGCAKWDTNDPEVFMPLRLGSLTNLVKVPDRNKVELPDDQLSGAVLEQMLSALDYLDWHTMCHCDVKPDNIVYYWLLGVGREKVYTFQLADFGLANYRQHAQTYCGTGFYIAPKIQDGAFPQSPKMDVWSLFATIADIHPQFKFPPENAQSYHRHILPAIRAAALTVPRLAPMVRENPVYRPSAAQMLVAPPEGRGLTTTRGTVPPMPELPTSQAVFRVGHPRDGPEIACWPLSLGPSPARNFPSRPQQAQSPGHGVKQPTDAAAFGLVNPITGRAPNWLDDSDLLRRP